MASTDGKKIKLIFKLAITNKHCWTKTITGTIGEISLYTKQDRVIHDHAYSMCIYIYIYGT